MANSQTVVTMQEQALQNDDAGALGVDFQAPDLWQPTILLETPQTGATVAGSNLAADGDRWSLLCAPRAAYSNYVFMCIAMRCTVNLPNITASNTFFENDYCFSIEGGCNDNGGLWQTDTSDEGFVLMYAGGVSPGRVVAFSPEIRGYPPRPYIPSSTVTAENGLGGFCITVQTWDATVAASATATVDARFLGFPQAVTRSAGLYVPRQYMKVN